MLYYIASVKNWACINIASVKKSYVIYCQRKKLSMYKYYTCQNVYRQKIFCEQFSLRRFLRRIIYFWQDNKSNSIKVINEFSPISVINDCFW